MLSQVCTKYNKIEIESEADLHMQLELIAALPDFLTIFRNTQQKVSNKAIDSYYLCDNQPPKLSTIGEVDD